ncbi:SH3 domain-containing protein [Ruminiclostridium papyrosolvens]|uniref:SH3b domain-containing protein n=1 Tax=Ruminiclostridium papyrosolvens C7 TaxID=1330534 RepID=U4R1A6_9FIRM|nr:SH3 domain-containing protein [Ruminiclostridium papyrosolvens]EPR10558.1 hypothetical protein L323_13490 [Ruminiclostridium papyrosolvens C7]
MKRSINLLMVLAIVFSIFTMPTYAKDIKADDGTVTVQWMDQFEVTASSLNVRSGPGTSYSKVGSLFNGDTGYLYDTSEVSANGYTWVPISKSDGSFWGWIALEYIQIIG